MRTHATAWPGESGPPHRIGLGWRIGVAFGALALVLVAALGWVIDVEARAQGERQSARRLAQLAGQVMSDLETGLHERSREISWLAEMQAGVDHEPARWRTLLEGLKRGVPHYSWIGASDASGRVLAATGGLLEGRDVSTRRWHAGGLRGPFVGNVHDAMLLASLLPPPPDGEPLRLLDFAAPLRDGERVVGVLGAHLDWRWADERRRLALAGVAASEQIEVVVADASGHILLGPVAPVPSRAQVVRWLSDGPAALAWSDGRRWFTAAAAGRGPAADPGLGWVVLVRQPEAAALRHADALRQRLAVAGVAAVLLFGLAGFWTASRLTAPLRAAAQRARALDAGAAPAGDEVSLLTRSIDRLQARAVTLAETNSELEGFSRSVSHDLRGPIGSIGLLLRHLLQNPREPLGEATRRALGLVVAECDRLLGLVDEMLVLAMVDQRPVQRAPVDMQQLVDEVLAALRPSHPQARFERGALPPTTGDALLLRQVWQNLIGNAAKFSSRVAEPRVRIDAQAGEGETIYRVQDNGAGFDMAQSHRLFVAFERLHAPSEFPGTGVGLSIVQRVVRRHGGRVWAESTPGAGACFCFALPAGAADQ